MTNKGAIADLFIIFDQFRKIYTNNFNYSARPIAFVKSFP